MTGFLIDTNSLELILLGEENIARRARENVGRLYLSSISAEEFVIGRLNGINRARSPRTSLSLVQAHEEFAKALEDIRLFPLLVYSSQAEAVFQSLPVSVKRVGTQDCRIGAQAIAHSLVVVTRNMRDFEAIGAPCEDWSLP